MTSIVFPGQGSQFVNMSKDFYDNFSKAKETFELIEEITKIDIKKIIFENSSNLINQTQFTQIAVFCASISIYNVLKDVVDLQKLNISHMLGHSLGEYTALTASGILSIEDCATLLKKRGQLMQDAYLPNQSGMAAIIGMDCSSIEGIIDNMKLNVEIANDNSPNQIVISGTSVEIAKSENFFKKAGAKRFIPLNVSAAFHSKLMINAENKMNNFINQTSFKNSSIYIVSNYTGEISNNNSIISQNLSKQMSNRVRWVESVLSLEKNKDINIIEIGPGRILTGLIKRISNNFNIKNIEFISDIESLENGF